MFAMLIGILILVIAAGIMFWLVSHLPLSKARARTAQVLVGLICLLVMLAWFFNGNYCMHMRQ